MAKKDSKKRRKIVEIVVPRNCVYCKSGTTPDYKDYESLSKYLSDRAKLQGKSRTGICAKHQRRISVAIKRARHLALLPYIPKVN
jgi:small subunit ribosomal protein S18